MRLAVWAPIAILVGLALGTPARVAVASSLAATPDDPVPTVTSAADGVWAALPPPYSRRAPGAVFDSRRNRMIVFGGDDADLGDRNDTWALSLTNPERWEPLVTSGDPPPARRGHTAIYDSINDRMIVFGGFDGANRFSDVWALSLSGTPSWIQLVPSGLAPAPRAGHSAVYDPSGRSMFVFGGYDGVTGLSDLWRLSLSGTLAWTQITTPGGAPPLRYAHASVCDVAHNRLIVFGGVGNGLRLADVWSYNLSGATGWTALAPSGTAPTARFTPAAVYDGANNRMLVFGGYDGAGQADAWALSLGGSPAWTRFTPAGAAPSGRRLHAAVFDAARNRLVTFAGADTSTADYLGDAWALALGGSPAWSELGVPGAPPRRQRHSAIADSLRDRVLIFGGYGYGTFFNDVWALPLTSAGVWQPIATAGTPPPPRYGHTAIYDRPRDRMIVFGGSNLLSSFNDVWALSLGGTPTWTQLSPAGAPPDPRFGHSAIYDPVRDRMVVFGGTGGIGSQPDADLWALSLSGTPTWTPLPFEAPLSFGFANQAAIYDPIRDQMVLFGGVAGPSGPYPIDYAIAISLTSPAHFVAFGLGTPPFQRELAQASYDAARDRMVVFGGGFTFNTVFAGVSDTWALPLSGDQTWTRLVTTGDSPNGVEGHTATFDPNRHRLVVFGGWDGTILHRDTHALSLGRALVTVPDANPRVLRLAAPRPNPARDAVTLDFELPRAAIARLEVFDLHGRRVARLVDGLLPAGRYSRVWRGRGEGDHELGAGVYFVRLEANGERATSRIVRLRGR